VTKEGGGRYSGACGGEQKKGINVNVIVDELRLGFSNVTRNPEGICRVSAGNMHDGRLMTTKPTLVGTEAPHG
jgi:hypothetical protein